MVDDIRGARPFFPSLEPPSSDDDRLANAVFMYDFRIVAFSIASIASNELNDSPERPCSCLRAQHIWSGTVFALRDARPMKSLPSEL